VGSGDRQPRRPARVRPTTVRVDLGAIRHNVRVLRELAGTDVCAVVKADGYGHGAAPVARAALEGGPPGSGWRWSRRASCCATPGIDAPILVLSEPPVAGVGALLDART
jgi:alanine racemase